MKSVSERLECGEFSFREIAVTLCSRRGQRTREKGRIRADALVEPLRVCGGRGFAQTGLGDCLSGSLVGTLENALAHIAYDQLSLGPFNVGVAVARTAFRFAPLRPPDRIDTLIAVAASGRIPLHTIDRGHVRSLHR